MQTLEPTSQPLQVTLMMGLELLNVTPHSYVVAAVPPAQIACKAANELPIDTQGLALFAQLKLPEPSFTKICPDPPCAVGRLSVYVPDVADDCMVTVFVLEEL